MVYLPSENIAMYGCRTENQYYGTAECTNFYGTESGPGRGPLKGEEHNLKSHFIKL